MMGKIEKFFQNPITKVAVLTLALLFIFSHFRTDVKVMASDERVDVFPRQVSIESNLAFLDLNALGTSSLWSDLENAKVAEGMPGVALSEFESSWAAKISFGNFIASSSVVFEPKVETGSATNSEDVVIATSSEDNGESQSVETNNDSENNNTSSVGDSSDVVSDDKEDVSTPASDADIVVEPIVSEEEQPVVESGADAELEVLPVVQNEDSPVVELEALPVVQNEDALVVEEVSQQDSTSNDAPVSEESYSPVSESPAPSASVEDTSSEGGDVSYNFWNNFKKGGSLILNNVYGFKQASAQESAMSDAEEFSSSSSSNVEDVASTSNLIVIDDLILSEEENIGLKDSLIFTNFVSKKPLEKNEISNVQLRLSLAGQSNFANDEFLIEYSLTGSSWEEAGRLPLFREASNASNGGYFLYAMPVFSSWQDLQNLQVRVSYLNPDISSSTDLSTGGVKVYLDSVWLEVDYAVKGEVKGEEELLSEDALGEKLFYDQDEVEIDGKKIKFEYTDDNSDESLIIKTDRANYVGLSEAEVYLSVTNSNDEPERFGLQVYFPESAGDVESVEKLNREAVESSNPILGEVKLPCSVSWLATSTTGEDDYICADDGERKQCSYLEDSGLTCVLENSLVGTAPTAVVENSWKKTNLYSRKLADKRNILKKMFDIGPKKKSLPAGFSVKKSTDDEQYSIRPGETQFFKVKVSFPQGSSGEFYFEAIGQDAYGLLDPWWNASWNYERPVNITFSGVPQTDFQVSVFVDTAALISAGKMRSDCGDIRFSDSNRWAVNSELSYYLEPGSCNRTNTRIWVKVPSLPSSKTIYMYYGNTAAVSASNGVNTFVYFQDFESNNQFTTGSMTLYRPYKAAKNGVIGLEGNGPGARGISVRNGVNSGKNLVWETWISPLSSSTDIIPGIQIAHPNGQSDLTGYTAYLDTRGGIDLGIRRDYDSGLILSSYNSYTISTDQWYFLSFSWRNNGLLSAYVYSAATSTTALAYCSSTDATYTDGEYGIAAQGQSYWDDYRIRKLATSSVAVALASEVQIINHSPIDPINLAQYENNTSTAIINTDWSGSQNIYLSATSSDKDLDDVTVYYQTIAAGSSFSTATTVPNTACANGTSYNSCDSKIWSNRGSFLPGWFDTEFPYRSKITILASQVDADLTNFPVYIDLARLGASNSFWKSVRSATGGDLVITNSVGTRLPLEVVSISTSSKTGEIYFKADNLYDLVNTDFYLYYGSSTASQPASTTAYGSQNVWPSNYLAVYHFKETTGVHKDSTSHGYNSTAIDITTQGSATGKLGASDYFTRANTNCITLPTIAYSTASGTITLWANESSSNGATRSYLFSHRNAALNNRLYLFEVSSAFDVGFSDSGLLNANYTMPTAAWHHYGLSWNGTRWSSLVDGAFTASGTQAALSGAMTNSWVGCFNNVQEYFEGYIDELRISNTPASRYWASTEYKNQNNPGAFISTSSQEMISWFDTEYPYRIMLKVKADQVDADLTNFPVYVDLSRLGSNNSFWTNSKKNSDGGDLLITNSFGVRMPLEVVFVSTSSKTGEIYFRADVIRDLINTDFYLYYGSSTASQPASSTIYGSQNVWSNGYRGVWHLSESSGSTVVRDSTSYNNHSSSLAGNPTLGSTGKLGRSVNFNGTNRILIPTDNDLEPARTLVISAWMNRGATQNTYAKPMWYGANGAAPYPAYGFEFNDASDSDILSSVTVGGAKVTVTPYTTTNNVWTYLTGSYDGLVLRSYVNGVERASTSQTGTISNYDNVNGLGIGDRYETGQGFTGYVDEVRVASTTRSRTWISTEYKNQNNSGLFLSTSTPDNYSNVTAKAIRIPNVPDSASGYKWQAIACDSKNICSMWSPFNSTLPNFRVDSISPTRPGALTLNRRTDTSVVLNFGSASTESNFAEYKIFYKAGAYGVNEGNTLFGSSSDSSLGYISFNGRATTTISGLLSGTQYVFNIWAYDSYGHKASSVSELSITTSGYPADPEDLQQYLIGNTVLPNGGWTYRNTVNLFASSTSENIYYELIPIASSFTSATSVPPVSCPYDTSYSDCSGKIWKNSLFWYDSDFNYRTKITTLNSAVNADLSNFPLYFDLSGLGANHYFWSHVRSNGGDILVTNSTGTRLPVEVVSINTTAKTGEIYFKADLIEDATSTDFYLYYGSSTAAQPASTTAIIGSQAVWSNSYKAVWHLDSLTGLRDSTGAHHGTSFGNPTNDASGRIGGSIAFDGVGDYINTGVFGAGTIDFGNSDYTANFWVKAANATAGSLLAKGTNDTTWSADEKQFYFTSSLAAAGNGLMPNLVGYACGFKGTASTIAVGSWNMTTFSRVDSSNLSQIYINGAKTATSGAYSTSNNADNAAWYLFLGRRISTDVTPNEDFNGSMDEVRLSSVARSSEWVSTEYNNQNSPKTFFSTSTEVNMNSLKTNNIPISGIANSATGYKWQVLACGTDGCSEWSRFNATTPNFLVDTVSPTRPGSLTLDSRDVNSITLNFGSASTESNFAEYKIYYRVGSSGVTDSDNFWGSSSAASLGSITYSGSGSTTITGLLANTNYVFNIWAYDLAGNKASGTTEVSVKTISPINNPSSLNQWRNGSTLIPNGGWTNSSTVSFSATSSGAVGSATVYYQVIGTTSSFTTSTSTPTSACLSNTAYNSCTSKIWRNSPSPSSNWYDSDFLYRTMITTRSSQIDADLTNFPVYFNLSLLGSNHHLWNNARESGGDIMVVDSLGNRLPSELVSFSTSTKTGELYFRANNIYDLSNTNFYIYYGSSTASQPASTTAYGSRNVWSNEYVTVWHFNETSGALRDSASGNIGTFNGDLPDPRTGGKTGTSHHFDGTGDYIQTDSAQLNSTNIANMTLSAWIDADALSTSMVIWEGDVSQNGFGAGQEMHLGIGSTTVSNYAHLYFGDVEANSASAYSSFTDMTSWHYLTGTLSNAATAPVGNLYIDGAFVKTDSGTVVTRGWDTNMRFGRPGTSERYYNGYMDEVRISSTTRSSTWISTEYKNQNNNAAFFATTTEESIVNSTRISVSGLPDSADGYRWQALACNVDGCSKNWVVFNASTPNFSVDTVAPTTPGNLGVDSRNVTDVTLNFGSAASDINFSEYKIYYKGDASGVTEADSAWTQLSDADLGSINFNGSGSTTVLNLSASTTYYFNIWAYDLAGNATRATLEVSTTTKGGLFNPSLLEQYRSASEALPNGDWTSSSTVGFYATSSNSGGDTNIYYELIANGSSFRTTTSTPASFCYNNTAFNSCTSKIWTNIDPLWWNSSWKYRRKITFGTNHSALPIGFTASTSMDTRIGSTNVSLASGNDVRVVWQLNGGTPLEIDRLGTNWNSANTKIEFRLQTDIATSSDESAYGSYYIYYNNASAGAPKASSSNVYFEYDDFNNNLLGSEWTTVDLDGMAGTSFTETSSLRIISNGADVWTPPDDAYGAIFRTVPGNFEATARILAQENPNGWAKAGIMVKNNMAVTQANNGYSIMAVTPSNNFAIQWDSDSDGYLDSYTGAGTTVYPDCLRLIKTGASVQGFYSADCTTFTSIPAVQPSSVNYAQNVGLFTSSHSNGVLSATWYDWIKITKTVADKEETSLGVEERKAPLRSPINITSIPESSIGYKWQAIACNQYACSSWVNFDASIPNFRVDTVAPTAPGNLSLVARRTNSLTLGFGSASTEANWQEYKIFYRQGATAPTEEDILYGSSSEPKLSSRVYSYGTSTVISGLLANTQYTFNIWAYDLYGHKASATAVTFQTSNTVREVFIYTSGSNAGWTDSAFAWDGVDDTYAYRSIPANSANDSSAYLLGTANNAPISAKTIFGVELGIEGYTGDPDALAFKIVPVFSGLTRGATSTILGSQFGRLDEDGTYYVDITSDPSAPASWTWNDIVNLDARVHALNSSTTGVTAYVDQIRLRVSVDAYPELTDNLSQSPVSSSTNLLQPNRWLNQDALILRADARDPDTAEMPSVFFQFVPTTTAFTSTTTKPAGACISGTAYSACASKIWLVNYVGAPDDFSLDPFVATSAITSIPDGSYHWQALTCDDDDICSPSWTNFSTATSTHIRIDTTKPTVPGWLSYVNRTSGSLTVGFGTTTTETNFNGYKIFYRKSSTTAVTEDDFEFFDTNLLYRNFNGAVTTTIAGLSKSSYYTINIWAYDYAGNKASSSRMLIASTTSGYTLSQTSYIIENDDGATVNLNSAPGLADVQLSNVEKGQRLITRFQLQNTGTDQTYNKRYKIQFENNTDTPGVWLDVGGSTAISYSYGLSGANGDAITSRKAAANGLAWVNGTWHENTNLTNMYNLPVNDYTEFAFALQTVNALPGKTYRLRLIDGSGSSTLDTYASYPALVISGLANKKYSKNSPSSLPSNSNDLTYFLDRSGYDGTASDNAVYDTITGSPAYTVYNFATKHKDYNSAITATWNGQSSLAPTSNTVYLQVYRFGSTNSWVTISSNNSASANTDFTLTGSIGYKMNEYYDQNNYVYWRVYQATGNATLRTDYYNLATSSLVASVGQKHYRWRYDNGSIGQVSWYNDDFAYRKKMTLDSNMIPGSGTLANFPVLISFTDVDLRGTSSGGYVQNASGWDILFTNASGTQAKLDYQIEKYDRTTGELVAWVEVPSLYAEKDTPVYVYYGNATTSAPTANVSGTWASDYKAVWHFDEAGALTTRLDSTANANNASTQGYDGDEDSATNIDGTDDFDGVNDYLSVSDSNSLDIVGNLSVSGWFNPDTTAKPLALTANGYARYQLIGMRWTASAGTDCVPDSSIDPAKINPYAGATYGDSSGSSWAVYDTSLASVYGALAQYQVDFNTIFGAAADNSESYIVTYLYSPRAKQVTFSVGSDDSRQIWINGHHVHQECVVQAVVVDDQSFNYTLKQGWNTFVMRVSNGTGDYGAQWRVSSTTQGMMYTSDPRVLIDKKEYQVSLKAGYLSAFYGSTTVDYAISSTSWQSFALTGDASSLNLYVNGLSRASTTFSSAPVANIDPIKIGYLFDGKLDEIRVLNSKLSKDWVMTSHNSQSSSGVGSGKFIKAISSAQTMASTIATWRELEDTGVPTLSAAVNKGDNIRLRLSAANTSGGIASNYSLRLQYASTTINCSSGLGTWYDVPVYATTQHFEMSSSSWIFNGDLSAKELTDAENYAFIDGSAVEETSRTSASFTLSEDQYTEIEWAIRPSYNASAGATYCFRAINDSGSLLSYYDRYAELTLFGNSNVAPEFVSLPSDGGSSTSTPTLYGSNVNFSALATDPEANEYYLAICRTDSISTGNGTAPTCLGGSWCISNLASSSEVASCSYTAATSTESLNWYAFACDLKWGAGVSKCSAASQGESPQEASSSPFKVNHRPTFTALSTTVNFRDPGGSFTIAATGAESDVDGPGDSLYFYACRTNSATFGTGCASGQTVCSSTGAFLSNPSCVFTDTAPTPPGANTYYGFIFDNHGAAATANSRSSTYSINNVIPTLGSLVLNSGNSISLNIKGAPDTNVQMVNTSVTDQNGCQSLVSATGVIYLSSAASGYNCAANNNNCYQISTANCVLSDCSGADDSIATYTCTAGFKFYAIPTDNSANNPWVDDNWVSRLQVYDGSNYVATSSQAVELNTNAAIDINEDLIDFGNGMNPGDNTGAVNQQITVVNYGNSPLDSDLSGSSMRNAINSVLSANHIQWNLSNFNYGVGNPLPVSPQLVNLTLGKPTSDTDVSDYLYWGLGLPATTTAGVYEGTTTMSAVLDSTDW